MKLVSFGRDGQARAGIWTESGVIDIGDSQPGLSSDMITLLAGGPETMRSLRELESGATFLDASNIRLLAPVPRPGKIICVGQNYWDHCREQNVEAPKSPILFAKYNNTITAPGAPIRLPALSEQVDYEAELAMVIGTGGSNISEANALEHVAGYTCLHDVSARDIQFADKQWTRGKSFDTFCPIGPYLVTRDEIHNPQNLAIRCTVSGEVLQDSNTNQMIFNCAFIISYISQSITLEPGDLIATGTPNGVGFFRSPQRFLRHGDTVTVQIEGIGELTNPVL